jgi:hypothetical protein
MNKTHKLGLMAVIAGAGIFAAQQASAWWGGDNWGDRDYYDHPRYWRYGGPYGYGGGPYGWGGGPYGWGGNPYGWGGNPYGGYPTIIQQSDDTPPPPPPVPE